VAEALSSAAGGSFTATTLPFTTFEYSADGGHFSFTAQNRQWRCDRQGKTCVETGRPLRPTGSGGPGGPPRYDVPSPDGTRTAFVRDHNLWVRDLTTGAEVQMTTDGEPEWAYARNDAGWTRSVTPVVVWSPDSRKIATFRHDSRLVRAGPRSPRSNTRCPATRRSSRSSASSSTSRRDVS
jgi:hypothetical protein